jgi:hypothetical protein
LWGKGHEIVGKGTLNGGEMKLWGKGHEIMGNIKWDIPHQYIWINGTSHPTLNEMSWAQVGHPTLVHLDLMGCPT